MLCALGTADLWWMAALKQLRGRLDRAAPLHLSRQGWLSHMLPASLHSLGLDLWCHPDWWAPPGQTAQWRRSIQTVALPIHLQPLVQSPVTVRLVWKGAAQNLPHTLIKWASVSCKGTTPGLHIELPATNKGRKSRRHNKSLLFITRSSKSLCITVKKRDLNEYLGPATGWSKMSDLQICSQHAGT